MIIFVVYRTWESGNPDATSIGDPYVDSVWSTEIAATTRGKQLGYGFEEIKAFKLDAVEAE